MLEIRTSTRFPVLMGFALVAKKAQVINGEGDCGRLSAGTEGYCIMCLLGSGIRIIHQNLGGHYVGLGGRRKHISGCCDPVSCPKPSLIGGRTKISPWSGGCNLLLLTPSLGLGGMQFGKTHVWIVPAVKAVTQPHCSILQAIPMQHLN